jgi:2-(1,2-epoxy-1,2-dihydrophenyl)acetyl-CoA isomerase
MLGVKSREETMTQELLTTIEGGVAVLTMNRPESLNALSGDMLKALAEQTQKLAHDSAIGCVVLTGAGSAFCAGGDVKGMAAGGRMASASLEEKARDLRARMEASRLLHEMPKPTIAMVNGVAAGAGLSLALACDMRIAAKSARMTTAFAKVGFSGDFGGHYFLHRLIGTAKARELYFTADILDSAQIEALGLANKVVDDAQLEAETMAFCKKLAAGPRVAHALMKGNMKIAEEGTLVEALEGEAWRLTRARDTEDHKEAARAFVEKRKPGFKGR